MFYNFLFPQSFRGNGVSLLILALRLFFGILFFTHGLDKLANFNELLPNFSDVLGFGSYMSLMVSIFCEFCCSLFLIAGYYVMALTIILLVTHTGFEPMLTA